MTATPNLNIGMMSTGSLSKEVIFNEAMVLVDALLARVVLSRATTAPPSNPADGAAYIIPTGATGDWSAHVGNLTFYYNGWHFIAPPNKMKVWVQSESRWYTWTASNSTWSADATGTISALDDLSDVVIGSGLVDGQVLAYNAATHTWAPKTGSTVVSMGDLSDVDVSGVLDGQVLAYNATSGKYEPVTPAAGGGTGGATALSELSDVDTAGAVIGQAFIWSGTKWHPGTPAIASIGALNDVTTAGAQVGDVLVYNGATWAASSVALQVSFLNVVDGPRTFVGAAGKLLRVDPTESELEYVDPAEIGVPANGTEGQVLVKTATGSEWGTAPVSVPTGGTAGQVLTKKTNVDGDTEWAAPAASVELVGEWSGANANGYAKGEVVSHGGSYWMSAADSNLSTPGADGNWLPYLPIGGNPGQVLARTSSGFAWIDAPSTLPTDGTAGQVLTRTVDGSAWADPPAGSGGSGTAVGAVAHDYLSPTLKLPVLADLPIALSSSDVTDASADKANCLLVAGTAAAWASSGSGFMRLKEFAPGNTFEVVALVFPMNSFGHYDFNGIVLRDANNDRNVMFGVGDYNTTSYCQAVRARLYGFNQNADNGLGSGFSRQPFWLKAAATGDGNVTFSVSENGHIWLPQLTESLTSFLVSVTHVGVGYTTRMGVSGYNTALRGLPVYYFHARTAVGLPLSGVDTEGGTSPSATHAPMSIELFASSTFVASEVLLRKLVAIGFTLPAGLGGSLATLDTAPTNAVTFSLRRNGVEVGSFTFAAGAKVATFSLAAATVFGSGDALSIVAPASADPTAAGLTVTIAGSY